MSIEEGSNDMKIQALTDYEGWGPSDHENVDLRIISSNNECLWVSSKQLIHHSPVFSAMIATCGDKSETLHLTDHEFESSLNLSSVFEAMAAIDENHQHDTTRAAVRFMTELTVLFAQKYEMKSVLAALKTHLFGLATQYPPSGGQCWLAAAHMSEWALCGRLIASIGTGYQGPLVVHMRKKLDCKGWTPGTMFELARVSTRFLWAACQAGVKHQIPGITANYINYQGMGEDLAKLMLMSPADAEKEVESWNKGRPSWSSA